MNSLEASLGQHLNHLGALWADDIDPINECDIILNVVLPKVYRDRSPDGHTFITLNFTPKWVAIQAGFRINAGLEGKEAAVNAYIDAHQASERLGSLFLRSPQCQSPESTFFNLTYMLDLTGLPNGPADLKGTGEALLKNTFDAMCEMVITAELELDAILNGS